MFTPLLKSEIKEIVNLQFKIIQQRLLKSRIKIEISAEAIEWLANEGYDPTFGARPLKRLMQKSILNELSKSIIAEEIKSDDTITIDVGKHGLIFINK
jgi:ATP-dependent Clp protease ATP-binding subunit ClpB